MNPSILLANHHTTLFTPTLKPAGIPPGLSSTRFRRYRYTISTVRASSLEQNPSTISAFPSSVAVNSDVFGEKRELTGVQYLVDVMSPPIRIAGSALVFAAAVAAGYGLGSRFGGSRNAGLGGAVAFGAAGAGAAYA
ncbi:TIC110, chloroplastic isoform X1 [Olea europaea subsp. europaea]|uniref:TIC110, chloroplastic isoform X1 n=1 Tax=Olea europaea subsp. europaea TaxID=158383 RepID=A0A8S0PXP5_OLEEU|nr:TIC110, chloroplastic isoform X1 [Olea europaea subsp. europaea]